MKIINILLLSLSLFVVFQGDASAETLQVIEDEWLWFSSNLEKKLHAAVSNSNNTRDKQGFQLGNLTYDKYFERNGQPPDHSFLQLIEKDFKAARIEREDIVFMKTGVKIPLSTDHYPSGSDKALPYIMEIPDTRIVLVVYPYYFYGCKDNDHIVELYTEDGALLHQFNSLPTHFVENIPQLLISPERSGCCDSLKWNMRFYDLKKGRVSKYGCPEGVCGDLLFVKLGQDEAFLIGFELIGYLPGIGAFIQTNVYIINDDGLPLASGKIIHALKNPSINKRNIQDISPFSISKLYSVQQVKSDGDNKWLLNFQNEDVEIPLMMKGDYKKSTPAVVFLIPKVPGKKVTIEFNNQAIDSLPTIIICESGSYELSREMPKMMNIIEVQSDTVNRIFF